MPTRSILIVDDEPAFCEMVGLMLEGAGHAVTLTADGVAGGRALEEKAFDLVITDLLMPEMDGLEFIARIRGKHPSVQILAMSGGGHIASREYLKLARGLGAHALIEKPFTQDKLHEAVAALLAAA